MIGAWLVVACLGLVAPNETSMLAEIEQLDRQLAEAEATLRHSTARRDAAGAQLRDIAAATDRTRVQQDGAAQQFRRRLRALARLPPSLTPALWQGAASFAEAVADSRLLRAIAAHDRLLHERLMAQGRALAELEGERQAQQQILDEAVAQGAARRAALTRKRQQRQALLADIRAQRPRAVALGAEAKAARAALKAVVARPSMAGASAAQPTAAAVSLAQQRGKLAWPAPGSVRVAFGDRIDLAYGTITAHNGWDIGAAPGSEVRAVAPGRVVYADWLRGYGQVIIIDHDDAFHAVVAHLATIGVAVGDSVEPGQALGTVGDTGSLRGPVLYFELRHRGTPVDPRDWLQRQPQGP